MRNNGYFIVRERTHQEGHGVIIVEERHLNQSEGRAEGGRRCRLLQSQAAWPVLSLLVCPNDER